MRVVACCGRPVGYLDTVRSCTKHHHRLALQLRLKHALTGHVHRGVVDERPVPGQAAGQERRRRALWAAGAASRVDAGMLPGTGAAAPPELPGMSLPEIAAADLWATGITPDLHPVEFTRPHLHELGARPIASLLEVDNGTRVLTAGAVTHRQRPTGTVVFLSLEDETGLLNVICPAGLYTRIRTQIRDARGLLVRGIMQRQDGAVSVLADQITPIHPAASLASRDWR